MTKGFSLLVVLGLVLGMNHGLLAEPKPNQLTEAEKLAGWKLLFDGDSAEHWRNYKQDSLSDGWKIQDGALVRADKGAGDIITKDEYQYFELSLEYKISKGGNSGLMFHVTEQLARPWQTGPEVQIQDNIDGHDAQKAGWLYQLYKPRKPTWLKQVEEQAGKPTPEHLDATRPAGEWNNLYLRIAANKCEVAMNGANYYYFDLGSKEWDQRVAKSKFAKFPQFGKAGKGHLCLQDHGNEVAFRNIKIRQLGKDGKVPNPVHKTVAMRGAPAFPNLQWEGWEGINEKGKPDPMRIIVLTPAGDGSGRLFAATQRGVIYVFEENAAATKATRFLDISERVDAWQKDNEEGLLGLTFHPQFKTNGQFVVYYSSAKEPQTSIISRFQVFKENPNVADPESEEILLKVKQPFPNHNGGTTVFGPDGYLYIGLGDGGARNDPLEAGQDLGTLLGSILRIDVDQASAARKYGIPADNPFVNRPGARPEIYAYGFRNVWRLSFDPKTDRLWAADVGQELWEEVNVVEKGGNYGWSQREGTHPFGNSQVVGQDPMIDPVWEYDHQVGKSVTGGIVYRGSKVPQLDGLYLYADYVSGKIWGLKYNEETGQVEQNVGLMEGGIPVLAFGNDSKGEVYYMVQSLDGAGLIQRFEPVKQ